MSNPAASPHRWKFFRTGGVDQVELQSGADVVHLPELNQKLWVALAMPTHGVDLDARTLALADGDNDGRIRAPDVLAAVKLVEENWVDPGALARGGASLSLDALKDGPVRAAARELLAAIGKADAAAVTLDDVKVAEERWKDRPLNGDGVIPADAATDPASGPEVKKLIEEIVATAGGTPDGSGKPGVDRGRVEAFLAAARATLEWHDLIKDDDKRKLALPLGDATFAAAAVLATVRAKIDDWFARSRLAAFDPRAATHLGGSDADLGALGPAKELTLATPELLRLPLARIEPGRPLSLTEHLNPAWAAPMAAFVEHAARPLGITGATLSEADWVTLQSRLSSHILWAGARPASPVAALPAERLRAIVDGTAAADLLALCDADLAHAGDLARVTLVERAVRYQRDLWTLLHNFVNFAEFYGHRRGTFQAGTLYLDARSCDLTFEVTDASKHGTLAGLSNAYLAYCDCTRPGGEKKSIVAAFTNGDSDYLMVGRNGLFYDRQGRDWDATITKVVSNPISVRQAFFSPYKKFVRMIEEQIAKRATAAEGESGKLVAGAAEAAAHADKTAPATPPLVPKKGIDVGTVAAIGVALGGIGAMVTGILAAFFGLGWWMPIGVLAIVLLISGPSMLLAWLKLRQRNLGPILDASGWAINGRAKINVPFGRALTHLPQLPAGARRALADPYAERRRPWKLYIALLILLALGVSWFIGRLDRYLPAPARSTSVMGSYAPAAAPPGLEAPSTPVAPTTTKP